MAGFGMGGSVATSSGVGQRAESEARQAEDRYTRQAESIPTGMGAIPGIAKGAAPALGQIVQQADNLNSSDTLGKVLEEASQTGLLSETESKLIGGQLGSPEGNEKARMMLGKTLPMRRADQKAIEFINSRMGPNIAEIKQTTDEGERRVKINKLVQDLQLQAAESEDEVTRTAIMKRVEDMFGLKGGNDKTAELMLRHQNRLAEIDAQITGYEKLDEGKHKRKGEFATEIDGAKKSYHKAEEAFGKTGKTAASLSSLNKQWEEYVNEDGEYDLVGFSKPYYGQLAHLMEQASNKGAQTPQFKRALKQQGQFMTFLTKYLKEMSGAAVTNSEAVRVLQSFGLGDYASELAPKDGDNMPHNDFIERLMTQKYSTLTPQRVVDGLQSLGSVLKEEQDKVYGTYAPNIEGSKYYGPRFDKIAVNLSVPEFRNATTKYDMMTNPDAKKLAKGSVNIIKDAATGTMGYLGELANQAGFIDGDPKPNPVITPPKSNPKDSNIESGETPEQRRERIKNFRKGKK